MTKYGEIKIVDFGLAKASSQLEKSEPGIIKGKFSYLSPEAALGKEVDHRTDLFAVGIILWEMLGSRRLFLGDTDFATVKLVQQAQIPPLGKINSQVTPELEQIVSRSLAREPSRRFPSARELAIALNDFLYQYGKPVGSFKIASLVESAVRDRQRVRPMQPSIIDKLIEEALFEFTSLQEASIIEQGETGGKSPEVGSAPLSLDKFEQARDWAREITIQETKSPERSTVPPQLLEGNLAALEEDTSVGTRGQSRGGGASTSTLRPTPIAPPHSLSSSAPPRKGSRGAVAFMVVLLVLAVTVGAYYTGLLPGATPH
jgi:serine/threonine-protein kinase